MGHLYHLILLASSSAAGSLVHAISVGILLASAVAICLRLLPGIRSATRFFLWLSVLLILLPLHLIPLARTGHGLSLPGASASFHLDPHWSLWIVGLWGMLTLMRASRLVQNVIELRRIAATATPVEPDAASKDLLMQGRRFVTLCTSTEVDRPSVVGFFRPRILIPSSLFHKFSDQELQQILLHEMEHLRRRDDWTNLLQKIALVVFPLNPVLFWVERRLCIERELACDDCVLNLTSARKSYAICLANLAEHSLLRRGISLTLGAWEKRSELSRRVHRIMRQPEQRMGRTATNIVSGILMTGIIGGAITLAHTPELISFAPSTLSATYSGQPDAAVNNPSTVLSKEVRPELVKAVMPEPRQTSAVQRSSERSRPHPIKAVHRSSKPQPERWIVLTSWQAESPAPDSLRYSKLTVSETSSSSSYAAVRVANGWLIFQL
ncbi:MAG TPA: M56 family metallopeptidase [Edaphobacter sp.]|jgi:hypothetical protein